MRDNPNIEHVARVLRSNEPAGSLATVLFESYTALSSAEERSAFVIALIGELLVSRGRLECATGREVTLAMIELEL